MPSKRFSTANNKVLEKNYVAEGSVENKIKARVKEKKFLEYLLARIFYLTYSFSDIKLLCCYRELGEIKSVKISFENIQNTISKNLREILRKKQYV